jgi:DNA polymerase eta
MQVEHVRLSIPKDQPLAVQQWDGLIAVNYAARAAGIARHERAGEALRKCPDLHLVHVETIGSSETGAAAVGPQGNAKVSLERYRQVSQEYCSKSVHTLLQHCAHILIHHYLAA